MKIADNAFKAYDIRGRVPEEINSELAYGVGRALADYLTKGAVAVGHDMRPDSAEFAKQIIKGLAKQGRKVFDLGRCSTDMTYFGIAHLGCVGGAMVTASHNPTGYNGIKLSAFADGVLNPIGEESGLLEIKQIVKSENYQAKPEGTVENKDVLLPWISHALEFAPDLKPLNVGMDFGNGMAGIFLNPLCEKTPLNIKSLYDEPDGNFPNHPADPLQEKNLSDLKELVKQQQLDVGIAFDGDGDRAVLVDENGEMVDPSLVGALITEDILNNNHSGTIVYNATASRLLPEVILNNKGKGVVSRTGHSFMKAAMLKNKAIFGAESSGHYYFAKNYNADSGLIAALVILQILSKKGMKMSELCAPLRAEYYQSGEKNFEVEDKPKMMQRIISNYPDGKVSKLDGISVDFPDWWFNVRPSNTEPLLRLNIEAKDQKTLDSNLNRIQAIIKSSLDETTP